MKYEGKVSGKYIELIQTIEDLENEINELKEKLQNNEKLIFDFIDKQYSHSSYEYRLNLKNEFIEFSKH